MALTAAGLAAWRLTATTAAVILGIATYSKPYNLWLGIPLGLEPLLAGGTALPWSRRVLESARRGAVLAGTVLLLFGANAAVTGEANYQGGAERKTFYGTFPFEWDAERQRETTFGNSGIWMSTNQLGPRVEGRDEGRLRARSRRGRGGDPRFLRLEPRLLLDQTLRRRAAVFPAHGPRAGAVPDARPAVAGGA
jgi:hypothetical protein